MKPSCIIIAALTCWILLVAYFSLPISSWTRKPAREGVYTDPPALSAEIPTARVRIPLQELFLSGATYAAPACRPPSLDRLVLKQDFPGSYVSVLDVGEGMLFMYVIRSAPNQVYMFVSNNSGQSFVAPRIRLAPGARVCTNVVLSGEAFSYFSPMLDTRVAPALRNTRVAPELRDGLVATARDLYSSHSQSGAACHDAHRPDQDDAAWLVAQPFKATSTPVKGKPTMYLMASRDGVSWIDIKHAKERILLETPPGKAVPRLGYNDGFGSLVWHAGMHAYGVFFRLNYDMGKRTVQASWSDGLNMTVWSEAREVYLPFRGDERGKWQEYYAVTVSEEDDDHLEGFISRMLKNGAVPSTQRAREVQAVLTMDVVPFSSRDGDVFSLVCGRDATFVNQSNVPTAKPGSKIAHLKGRYATFPVAGVVHTRTHTHFFVQASVWRDVSVFRYSVPRYRFAGMQSMASRGAEIRTCTLVIPRGATVVAVRAELTQTIEAAIETPQGQIVSGFDFANSVTAMELEPNGEPRLFVRWRPSSAALSRLAGRECRVVLKNFSGIVFDLEFL